MKHKLILVVLTVLLFASCKKRKDSISETYFTSPGDSNLNAFFAANAGTAQSFTINAAQVNQLMGIKGSEITVPASAFMTQSGATVSGSISLSITELYSKKEMLLNKAPSITSSELLLSVGEIKITATQNGQELRLFPGKKITVKMPAGPFPYNDMKVHYASYDVQSKHLLWQLSATSQVASVVADTNNVINPYFYVYNSDSLNWQSCARPYALAGTKTSFSITVHGNYNSANTSIYVSLPERLAIGYLHGHSSQTYYNGWQLPIGTTITVVAISKINGKYYFSLTNTTVSLNQVLDINLKESSEAEILAQLANL
jgi:hypothetical protein